MSRRIFPQKFKAKAVKQTTIAGHSFGDIDSQLGMATNLTHS
jgi:hypothetical protein